MLLPVARRRRWRLASLPNLPSHTLGALLVLIHSLEEKNNHKERLYDYFFGLSGFGLWSQHRVAPSGPPPSLAFGIPAKLTFAYARRSIGTNPLVRKKNNHKERLYDYFFGLSGFGLWSQHRVAPDDPPPSLAFGIPAKLTFAYARRSIGTNPLVRRKKIIIKKDFMIIFSG